ncbi:galactose-binding domain-like protein [Phascolomyces articulosus]|uniref:Galactose-binding domain-like protein n=1 Tax=Phascolomyces articulosus TaxID=60185 RepID=A0AAD5JPQ0_9FUNG|nr:galactose-binding domain-like protein [Phascolomyces articulosus]
MGAIQSCLAPAPYTELCAKQLDDTILSYYTDLASAKFEGSIISASDQYFGNADNLIDENEPHVEEELDRDGERDGWQSKRHVEDAWAVVRLGCQGHLYGFDINTVNFNDAAPLTATIEAAQSHPHGTKKWVTLLPNVRITPNQHNFFLLGGSQHVYSQVKLTISPGGGVARLRCYGNAVPDWPRGLKSSVNLASVQKGARITRWTDIHHANNPNILMDHGKTTADGWETPHSRDADRNDYVVIQLASPGTLNSLTISTEHYLGNAPNAISIDGCYSVEEDPAYDYTADWIEIVQRETVKENTLTIFNMANNKKVFSHLRLTVHPDGGIQQILAMGHPYIEEEEEENAMDSTEAKNDAMSSDESIGFSESIGIGGRRKRHRASADKAARAIHKTLEIHTRAKRRQIIT